MKNPALSWLGPLAFLTVLVFIQGCAAVPASVELPVKPGVNAMGLWLPWWFLAVCLLFGALIFVFIIYKMQHIQARLIAGLGAAYMALKVMAWSIKVTPGFDEKGGWTGPTDFVVQFGSSNWDALFVVLVAMLLIFWFRTSERNLQWDLGVLVDKHMNLHGITELAATKSYCHYLLKSTFKKMILENYDPWPHPPMRIWLYIRIYGKPRFDEAFQAFIAQVKRNQEQFVTILTGRFFWVVGEMGQNPNELWSRGSVQSQIARLQTLNEQGRQIYEKNTAAKLDKLTALLAVGENGSEQNNSLNSQDQANFNSS